MKHKLDQAATVGDLATPITVDELEMESVSLILDPRRPVLSFVLVHRASGWQHNVVYSDSSAVEFWAKGLEPEFDKIIRQAFLKMVADKKLPPGTLV